MATMLIQLCICHPTCVSKDLYMYPIYDWRFLDKNASMYTPVCICQRSMYIVNAYMKNTLAIKYFNYYHAHG